MTIIATGTIATRGANGLFAIGRKFAAATPGAEQAAGSREMSHFPAIYTVL